MQIVQERVGESTVRRPQILVVDDDASAGMTMRLMLEGQFDVQTVVSVDSAIAKLEEDASFDCILCDLTLGPRSGADVYRWIGTNLPDLEARVVFITGGAFTNESAAFLDHTPAPKLLKPFSLRALEACIENVLAA